VTRRASRHPGGAHPQVSGTGGGDARPRQRSAVRGSGDLVGIVSPTAGLGGQGWQRPYRGHQDTLRDVLMARSSCMPGLPADAVSSPTRSHPRPPGRWADLAGALVSAMGCTGRWTPGYTRARDPHPSVAAFYGQPSRPSPALPPGGDPVGPRLGLAGLSAEPRPGLVALGLTTFAYGAVIIASHPSSLRPRPRFRTRSAGMRRHGLPPPPAMAP
jgi:hypothetical protein